MLRPSNAVIELSMHGRAHLSRLYKTVAWNSNCGGDPNKLKMSEVKDNHGGKLQASHGTTLGDTIIVIDNRNSRVGIPKIVSAQGMSSCAIDAQYGAVGLGVYPNVFGSYFDPIFSFYHPSPPF